jgi:hypothetical protein
MIAVIIHPSGMVERKTVRDFQKIVGGYYTTVRTIVPHVAALVNEDGLRLKLPDNPVATNLAEPYLMVGDKIVGTMLIVGMSDEDFMDAPWGVEHFVIRNAGGKVI